jgi:[ribosomal protein S5]-alanine N-acetyltransferase
VRRYLPYGTRTREETRAELAWVIDVHYARYGYGSWAAVVKDTGAFAGHAVARPPATG